MTLQNRVDPFGAIHAVAARGMFTGNRGILHDPATKTLLRRRWSTRAWIICACDFPGRRREVMGRNSRFGGAGWTELFFLDEPTALAAGHRPCFYCRRRSATLFAACYADAFGIAAPRAAEIDQRLHGERLASSGGPLPALSTAGLAALPEGAMAALGARAFARREGVFREWSFTGWGAPLAPGALPHGDWRLLTPPATVAVLKAGYRPAWHTSAET